MYFVTHIIIWFQVNGRLVGFGSGMIVMAILTWCILGEGMSTKTLVSLGLATTLVFIQIFWK